MPGDRDTEWGTYKEKVRALEEDMDKVLGREASSHASRLGVLEDDKKTRVAVHATIATCVTVVFSAVVWIASSGVIERVDALRHDLRMQRPAAVTGVH